MRLIFSILIALVSLTPTHSQKLKKIIKKRDPYTIEEYFVLKSKKSVRHGSYILKSSDGALREKGYYKNNMKDSLWIYYVNSGLDTIAWGWYKEDKPAGVWTEHNGEGHLKYKYNCDTGEVIEYNWLGATNIFPILKDGDWFHEAIDSPPFLVGRGERSLQTIFRQIRYPLSALKDGVGGKILVTFVVDTQGNMSDVAIEKGVRADLDKEALRVVSLLDSGWVPAMKDGRPITVQYFLPISFGMR